MKVLELSKNYCNKFYNGNYEEMIKNFDGVLYDDEIIKNTFNFGNGSEKNFNRYMKNNKVFCKYYDLINKKYIY